MGGRIVQHRVQPVVGSRLYPRWAPLWGYGVIAPTYSGHAEDFYWKELRWRFQSSLPYSIQH